MKDWTQSDAIALCVELEKIAPKFGAHVALTGGCLYGGTRKECDIILYRIRQAPKIDFEGLFEAMTKIGVTKLSGFGFCHKAIYQNKPIDFLSPEEAEGQYPEKEEPLQDWVKRAIEAQIGEP